MKFVPAMLTVVPIVAVAGVNPVIVGTGGKYVKPAFAAAPPGVVTLTEPLAPTVPLPTTAVICVAEAETIVAATPTKLTAVAPFRLEPEITIVLPAPALAGVNEAIIGAGKNVNPANEDVPAAFVTLTAPDAPPAATFAVICVSEFTTKLAAATPPNFTAVVPVKPVPTSTTDALTAAVAGAKLVRAGGVVIKVNPAFEPAPFGVVTLTKPLAPAPITAVIFVADTTVNDVVGVPPKSTAVAVKPVPLKPVPVIVIVAPTAALVGVNAVTVGAGGKYVKPASVPVPNGVVTLTAPVAPAPTTAVICVSESTVKLAAARVPNFIAVAPIKPVPVSTTLAPCAAFAGVNTAITGAGINVKPASVPTPESVPTLTAPVAPPAATFAVICVSELTTKLAAATVPNFTVVAPEKSVPVITTVPPAPALVGAKLVTTGAAGMNVKPASVPVPPGVVTLTLPVVPLETIAVICVSEFTTNDAAVLLPNFTLLAPVKFRPVITTASPGLALVGVNAVITGLGAIKTNPVFVTVPPGVVTAIAPEAPVLAGIAVICVSESTVKDKAETTPNFTALAPVKPVPLITTDVPAAAVVGVNAVIVGTGAKLKPASVPVPFGVVTATTPETVPAATFAVIFVAEFTVNDVAATVPVAPPKLTAVVVKPVPLKPVPLIVTVPPAP